PWSRDGGSTRRARAVSRAGAPPRAPGPRRRCSCALPSALSTQEVGVERIEDGPAVLEARVVVAAEPGDPGDQVVDARGLFPVELRVLEVDVVNHLGECTQPRVPEVEG